jgi:hypothetical protein
LLDVSKSMRKSAFPALEIGACLREDSKWNRDLLMRIAAADSSAVDFLIRHPYDFNWMKAESDIGSFYARAGGLELNAESLKADMRTASELGHGRWRMVATEWNTHPPLPLPADTAASIDLAAALNMAAAVQMFWEAGVDSAQFFLIADKVKNGRPPHFAMIAVNPDGSLVFNPTYHVMRLYGEACYGMRLASSCDGPTYQYPAKDGKMADVPLVRAAGLFDEGAGELRLLVVNRHADSAIEFNAMLDNFAPAQSTASMEILTGETALAQKAVIKKIDGVPLEDTKQGCALKLSLEPHSFTVVRMKGGLVLSDFERLSKRLHFIKDWKVCGVFDPPPEGSPDHGLANGLPCGEGEPDLKGAYTGYAGSQAAWADVRSSEQGYVDVFAPHRVGGLDRKCRVDLQARAVAYVYSPDARDIGVSLGADYWGRLYVNEDLVADLRDHEGVPAADTLRGKARLKKGWNRISVRVASGSGGFGFWAAVENTGGLSFSSQKEMISRQREALTGDER